MRTTAEPDVSFLKTCSREASSGSGGLGEGREGGQEGISFGTSVPTPATNHARFNRAQQARGGQAGCGRAAQKRASALHRALACSPAELGLVRVLAPCRKCAAMHQSSGAACEPSRRPPEAGQLTNAATGVVVRLVVLQAAWEAGREVASPGRRAAKVIAEWPGREVVCMGACSARHAWRFRRHLFLHRQVAGCRCTARNV